MLAILMFVGTIVWVVAVVLVLVHENYPESLWRFLLGIVRWEACLLAYLPTRAFRTISVGGLSRHPSSFIYGFRGS